MTDNQKPTLSQLKRMLELMEDSHSLVETILHDSAEAKRLSAAIKLMPGFYEIETIINPRSFAWDEPRRKTRISFGWSNKIDESLSELRTLLDLFYEMNDIEDICERAGQPFGMKGLNDVPKFSHEWNNQYLDCYSKLTKSLEDFC
jgi:hypothetical protein